MSSGITIISDEITPLLERVKTAAAAKGLAMVGARAMGSLIKDHLYKLDGERHKYGRHFYRQAGDSVSARMLPQGAAVSITQLGFRQRLYGGPIDPINGQFLTIPVAPEAFGHRAREFPDLEVKKVLDAKGVLRLALVRRPSQAISFRKRKQSDGTYKTHVVAGDIQTGEVMYWLVTHVDQKADPSVLPTNDEMAAAAVDAMKKRLGDLQGGVN